MGKNRHQKDKLYLIPSEYAELWGGCKSGQRRYPFRSLPFYCCGLTLVPFKDPVCVKGQGIVFDKAAILSWLTKYKQNPVTGEPLSRKDLIDLTFHKNANNEYHCPVTYKVFNEHTDIVANAKTGHVYSKDAIDEICRKGKTWLDLITGEKFGPKDLITIQDPHNFETRKVEQFHFVKQDLDVEEFRLGENDIRQKDGTIIQNSSVLLREALESGQVAGENRKRIHKELMGNIDPEVREEHERSRKKNKLHSLFTTAAQAASLTSTAVTKKVGTEYRELTDGEVREELYNTVRAKKLKCHVKLVTSLGALNLELRSDLVPEAVHSFMIHAKAGYYDSTIFHRLIKRFMIQGGDPEGTGKGGKCAFEGQRYFVDHFHPELRHNKRGVVSMANSGMDTNGSQFFITFGACPHLDDKHTVFGMVVDGLDVLSKLEALPTGKDDRPINPPRIVGVIIYTDAFAEAEARISGVKPDKDLSTKELNLKEKEASLDFIKSLQ